MTKLEDYTAAMLVQHGKKYEEFTELFWPQFARLAQQAGVYIGRMSNKDRELVIVWALELAWNLSEVFDPAKMSLLYFWNQCLQGAVKQQVMWRIRYFDGWAVLASADVVKFDTATWEIE